MLSFQTAGWVWIIVSLLLLIVGMKMVIQTAFPDLPSVWTGAILINVPR